MFSRSLVLLTLIVLVLFSQQTSLCFKNTSELTKSQRDVVASIETPSLFIDVPENRPLFYVTPKVDNFRQSQYWVSLEFLPYYKDMTNNVTHFINYTTWEGSELSSNGYKLEAQLPNPLQSGETFLSRWTIEGILKEENRTFLNERTITTTPDSVKFGWDWLDFVPSNNTVVGRHHLQIKFSHPLDPLRTILEDDDDVASGIFVTEFYNISLAQPSWAVLSDRFVELKARFFDYDLISLQETKAYIEGEWGGEWQYDPDVTMVLSSSATLQGSDSGDDGTDNTLTIIIVSVIVPLAVIVLVTVAIVLTGLAIWKRKRIAGMKSYIKKTERLDTLGNNNA